MTQTEIYQKMPSHEKLQIACDLQEFARNRLELFFKSKYPSLSPREIKIKIAQRMLGESARVLLPK